MARVTFEVLGKPEPAGSKRAFIVRRRNGNDGVAVTDDNPKAKSWQLDVRTRAWEAMDAADLAMFDGPVGFAVVFTVRRPKGHFRTGKFARFLRESAPEYPTTKPDCTKLLRAVEDALTGVVWRDDAQVVEQVVSKRYGEPEGAQVNVWTL